MKKKRILLIDAHPNPDSYCAALSDAYCDGAKKTGAQIRSLALRNLNFDPILHAAYKSKQPLEADLKQAQDSILWAEHLVFVYPTWWGTQPALLKGFLDRSLLPGFAFRYKKDSVWWDKLLTGRTARLIVTMDTPAWYYRLRYGRPGHQALKKMTLEFCGIKPVRITSLGPIKKSSREDRQKWLKQVYKIGQKQC